MKRICGAVKRSSSVSAPMLEVYGDLGCRRLGTLSSTTVISASAVAELPRARRRRQPSGMHCRHLAAGLQPVATPVCERGLTPTTTCLSSGKASPTAGSPRAPSTSTRVRAWATAYETAAFTDPPSFAMIYAVVFLFGCLHTAFEVARFRERRRDESASSRARVEGHLPWVPLPARRGAVVRDLAPHRARHTAGWHREARVLAGRTSRRLTSCGPALSPDARACSTRGHGRSIAEDIARELYGTRWAATCWRLTSVSLRENSQCGRRAKAYITQTMTSDLDPKDGCVRLATSRRLVYVWPRRA